MPLNLKWVNALIVLSLLTAAISGCSDNSTAIPQNQAAAQKEITGGPPPAGVLAAMKAGQASFAASQKPLPTPPPKPQ